MRKWVAFPILCLVLLPGLSTAAEAPSWQLRGDGRWEQVTTPTTAPVKEETLDRVEEMLQHKQAAAARKILIAWFKTHNTSPVRDRAVFLLGQANFLDDSRIMAFYNFDELLDLYPASVYYYPALQRQFDIADQFLRGYKRHFLGIAMLGATTEATEMLFRIQQRSPGSPLAEKALLRVADYFYASSDFDVAEDAYAAYVRSYPRSPYLPRVRLRQAFAALAQFRGIKFDATHVIDARQQLTDLSVAYPQLAAEENITAIVERIDVALARKVLTTADFLWRSGKPQGAAYYYQYLVRTFPDFPETQTARQKLQTMPDSALQQPQLPEVIKRRLAAARQPGRLHPRGRKTDELEELQTRPAARHRTDDWRLRLQPVGQLR